MSVEIPKFGENFLLALFKTSREMLYEYFKIVAMSYVVELRHYAKMTVEESLLEHVTEIVLQKYGPEAIIKKNLITRQRKITLDIQYMIEETISHLFHRMKRFIKINPLIEHQMNDWPYSRIKIDYNYNKIIFNIPYLDGLMQKTPQEILQLDKIMFASNTYLSFTNITKPI